MSEVVSEVVSDVAPVESAPASAGNASEGFEWVASVNDGFLGTGYSTAVELALIAMALILAYVVHGTLRYLMPGFRLVDSVANVLGLRD